MTKPKAHPEYAILADLLEMADNEFSNHGCNDYSIPNTPETIELLRQAHEWNTNSDPAQLFEPSISKDGKEIYVMDYYLMGYFAHLFRKMAEAE